jgi:hypothetical protein
MDASNQKTDHAQFSPKDIVLKYLPFLPWVILSVIVFLSLAFIKLRYSTPIYNVSGRVLLKDKNPYGSNAEKFGNILAMPDDNNNLNNVIEIIKSRSMAARVVRSLDLQKQFFIKGKIRTSLAHPTDVPFKWIIYSIKDSTQGANFLVRVINNNQFQLNEYTKNYNFNQIISVDGVDFKLQPIYSDILNLNPEANEYIISWGQVESLAIGLSSSILVQRVEGTSIIDITYATG